MKYIRISTVVDARQADKDTVVETANGTVIAKKGDYILKDVEGKEYPCRKSIFEKTYLKQEDRYIKKLQFGEALELLKLGKKLRREVWDKDTYIYLTSASSIPFKSLKKETSDFTRDRFNTSDMVEINPHIDMFKHKALIIGYILTMDDMLAHDWETVID